MSIIHRSSCLRERLNPWPCWAAILFLASLGCTPVVGATRPLKLAEAIRLPADWFRGEEGRQAIANVLSWQNEHGSWPKNTDTLTKPADQPAAKLSGTFDNGATRGELRFLARAFRETQDARCRAAFGKGLQAILDAQYPTGGWPQSYPPGSGYPRHITFNDGTMVGLMEFLREVAKHPDFGFVAAAQREAAGRAFDRGLDCILKCQIKVEGKLTVWCAQHDAVTLEPRPARTYELVSLSGAESAGILRLLMSVEPPSAEIRRAIEAGVAWFESAQITGLRQERIDGNKVMVKDPTAPPLWARFYEIDAQRPFFCGRDGVKKYDIAEIEAERRNGYAWYGDWGTPLLAAFTEWKRNRPQ